jgi:hypothetical protein
LLDLQRMGDAERFAIAAQRLRSPSHGQTLQLFIIDVV